MLRLEEDSEHARTAGQRRRITIYASAVKPSSSGLLEDLKSGAISATVLRPGVAHGRFLVGQVVGPPTMMAACRVILREASGELLELFLYNIVHRREEMDQLFREGSTVLVKEPFMKVMGDGNMAIRIDSPTDVLIDPPDGSASAATIRKAAERYMSYGNFQEAIQAARQCLRQTESELESKGADEEHAHKGHEAGAHSKGTNTTGRMPTVALSEARSLLVDALSRAGRFEEALQLRTTWHDVASLSEAQAYARLLVHTKQYQEAVAFYTQYLKSQEQHGSGPLAEAAAACSHCHKTGATSRCSVCKSALYCDRACQHKGWKSHKLGCKPAAVGAAVAGAFADWLQSLLDMSRGQFDDHWSGLVDADDHEKRPPGDPRAAQFVHPALRVVLCPGRGRGVVLSAPVKAHSLLLVEQAVAASSGSSYPQHNTHTPPPFVLISGFHFCE
jgi:tetratricopeptide (TPR) repeat protein